MTTERRSTRVTEASVADAPLEEVRLRVPDAPSFVGALRSAAVDLFSNPVRMIVTNFIWGVLFVVAVLTPLPVVLTLVALGLLAIPASAIYELSARIARDDAVTLRHAFAAYRRYLGPAILLGGLIVIVSAAFAMNLALGLATGDAVGIAFATMAGWAFVFLTMYVLVAWPIIVDPRRQELSVRARLRLAAFVVLAHPLRIALLAGATVLVLILSTVVFAAVLTLSLAFVALVGSRYVLPLADRLEGRATHPVFS